MAATMTEQTEVLADQIRPVPSNPSRTIIPVAVANSGLISGPWAKAAALEYAKRKLGMRNAGVVAGTAAPATRIGAYHPEASGRNIRTIEQYRDQAALDAEAAAAEAKAAAANPQAHSPKWVVEIVVEDLD